MKALVTYVAMFAATYLLVARTPGQTALSRLDVVAVMAACVGCELAMLCTQRSNSRTT